jgi:hypothetical protein
LVEVLCNGGSEERWQMMIKIEASLVNASRIEASYLVPPIFQQSSSLKLFFLQVAFDHLPICTNPHCLSTLQKFQITKPVTQKTNQKCN